MSRSYLHKNLYSIAIERENMMNKKPAKTPWCSKWTEQQQKMFHHLTLVHFNKEIGGWSESIVQFIIAILCGVRIKRQNNIGTTTLSFPLVSYSDPSLYMCVCAFQTKSQNMSLLNEHGKCATWKFISNLQVIRNAYNAKCEQIRYKVSGASEKWNSNRFAKWNLLFNIDTNG